MEIPKKFKINTKDFKIYFDNKDKKHVCESIETGEKTNISVIGTLLQMGILEPIKIESDLGEKITSLNQRIENLELKIDRLINKINVIEKIKDIQEKIKEEKPEPKMNERIMKKVLEKTQEPEEIEIPEEKIEVVEEPESNAVKETNEEIENWNEI
jgi:hypothetical protein